MKHCRKVTVRERINDIRSWFRKRWSKISSSIITYLIFSILGLISGVAVEFNFVKYNEDKSIILIITGFVWLLISITYCYRRYNKKRLGKISDLDKTNVKIIYYSVSFFAFSVYYALNKKSFILGYSQNTYGIEQNQYIFLVNFIGYFIISTVIYFILFNKYSMKKISKEGIELEEKSVSASQNSLIENYKKIIDNFSEYMCNIDNRMQEMNEQGFIRDDYTLEEYLIFIGVFIDYIVSDDSNISIIIESEDQFEDFVKDDIGYNHFLINKIITNISYNKVYAYENYIFVGYYSSVTNNEVVFIIKCEELYPASYGVLLYNYITVIEAIYLKYI